jgi:hypothetical protein
MKKIDLLKNFIYSLSDEIQETSSNYVIIYTFLVPKM